MAPVVAPSRNVVTWSDLGGESVLRKSPQGGTTAFGVAAAPQRFPPAGQLIGVPLATAPASRIIFATENADAPLRRTAGFDLGYTTNSSG